eukprot:11203217-Lingulodinium_polyedra.AAC.1
MSAGANAMTPSARRPGTGSNTANALMTFGWPSSQSNVYSIIHCGLAVIFTNFSAWHWLSWRR